MAPAGRIKTMFTIAVTSNDGTAEAPTPTKIARPVTMSVCERGLVPDKMDYWRDFLRIIDRMVELGCTRDSNPRLGDLVYCMLFLIELGATESCGSSENCCRKRLSGNPVLRDFFLLSVRDFIAKHLETLASLTSPEERCKVFSMKAWFSCRVHSDSRVIETNSNLTNSDVELAELLNGRVCFIDRDISPKNSNEPRLVGIDSFSPTLALYTVSNLRDVYAATALADTNRFDDMSEKTIATTTTSRKRKRAANALSNLVLVGRPPSKKSWFQLCATGGKESSQNDDEWPKQSLFVDVGGSIYRDKKLFRYIDRAIANSDTTDETINNVRAFVRPEDYEQVWRNEQFNEITRHATFSRFLDLLDGLSLSWAKLHIFEPDIFG